MYDSVKVIDVDIEIPRYVLDTLALGPKHPVLDKFDLKTSLAEVEGLLEFCEPKDCPTGMVNEIEAASTRYHKKADKQLIHKNVVLTKKFLEKNDLMAVQMDKANGFAIMPKCKYNQKMEDILSSKQFEKWFPKRKNAMDPVLSLEEK